VWGGSDKTIFQKQYDRIAERRRFQDPELFHDEYHHTIAKMDPQIRINI
jgi:hypothetical protein